MVRWPEPELLPEAVTRTFGIGEFFNSEFPSGRGACNDTWGSPKIRGTTMGVPIIRIRVFGVLYGGPSILGNYYL